MDLRPPPVPSFPPETSDVGGRPVTPTGDSRRHDRPSLLPRASIVPRPARRRPAEARAAHRRVKARPSPATTTVKRAPRPKAHDETLAADLLNRYTPLVRQIVGGFQRRLPRNVLRDDLLAAGMSGLWDAIRKQGAERNDSFDWYVRVRIRGAILDELRAQDWLPRRARANANEREDGSAPSVVRFDDVSSWEQGKCLASGEASNSEAILDAKFTKETLTRAVELLPSRERHIVSMHYFKGVKFKDLGRQLGVSEPRISQLHSRAMKRLRTLMDAA